MKHGPAIFALVAAQLAMGAPPGKKAPPLPYMEINPSRLDPDIPAQISPDLRRSLSFAFSPDEHWLAIVAGVSRPQDPAARGKQVGPSVTRVLLLPLNGPAKAVIQIDPGFMVAGSPVWSPTSDAFLVRGFVPRTGNQQRGDGIVKAYNVRGEEVMRHTTMALPPVGGIYGFLDSKTLLTRRVSTAWGSNAFQATGLQGDVIDTWKVRKEWNVVDISPDRHLLLVSPDDQNSKTLVVDYASKKVLLSKDNPYSWPSFTVGGGPQYFAEQGMTFCSVGDLNLIIPGQPDPRNTDTECWDADSGKRIARFQGFPGGAPAAVTSRSSLIVLTHNGLFSTKKPDSVPFEVPDFGGRILWDFRSGAEIASWDPLLEDVGGIYPLRYAPVAISSTGRYVAEGAGDFLRLYHLR